jgi:CBS domain-containing protein
VLDAGTRDVMVTYPEELLHDASNKMLRHNIGRLPVLDPKNPRRVIGYLGRLGHHGSPAVPDGRGTRA